MKIEKLVLIILFNITLLEYGVNASSPKVPTEIVEQIKNILEICQNWIKKNERSDNRDFSFFISQLENFGVRIIRIFSSMPEHDIWWLWELSILTNSCDKVYEILKDNNEPNSICLKLGYNDKIKDAIELIITHIEVYLETKVSVQARLKKRGILEKILSNKNKTTTVEIESIDEIPKKLSSLDFSIENHFGNKNNNNVNSYTPQNLFLCDIIKIEYVQGTLSTNCSAIEWKQYNRILTGMYREAIFQYVDINQTYSKLIEYRKFLIEPVVYSFYVHLYIHVSFLYIYHFEKNEKYKQLEAYWNPMKKLVFKFKFFFDFQEDYRLGEICNILCNNEELPEYSGDVTTLYDITNFIFKRKNSLYKINNSCFVEKLIKSSKSDEEILLWVQKNLKNLDEYLKKVFNLFKNVDFKSYRVFYNTIPYNSKYLIYNKWNWYLY